MPAKFVGDACPICSERIVGLLEFASDEVSALFCLGCGTHRITRDAANFALKSIPPATELEAAVAFAVRQIPEGQLIDEDRIRALVSAAPKLPSALEQMDRLIQWMAQRTRPGQRFNLTARSVRSVVGAVTLEETQWLLTEAVLLGDLMGEVPATSTAEMFVVTGATLTVNGWKRWGELLRSGARSRHAFMAMKFSDEMFAIYENFMKPAAKRADFELRPLAGEHQTAGSIDNRMRVEIRTSRFMVCDLSDGNQGAYWEAGFAEGIGRPVIYTCRKDVLDAKGVHFDTRQQLIIPWDPDDMAPAMRNLTNVIRATLPAEAKLTDD